MNGRLARLVSGASEALRPRTASGRLRRRRRLAGDRFGLDRISFDRLGFDRLRFDKLGADQFGSASPIVEPVIGQRVGPIVLPNTGTLRRILKDYGLRSVIDDDGDLAVRWEKFSVYFFHYGQDEEVLQARLYLNRRFDVDLRPTLALVLDDWNRSKLFPKAYTVLPDDGLVGICAEQAFDFEGGTSREQLKFTIGMWLQNLQQFADWTEEHV